MKVWEISLMLYIMSLLFTAMVSLNDSEGLGLEISSTLSMGTETNATAESLKEELSAGVEDPAGTGFMDNTALSIWASVKLVWIAVGLLITALWNATINSGPFLNILMGGLLPAGFQLLISAITIIIFVIGIVQFIAGRSMKEME